MMERHQRDADAESFIVANRLSELDRMHRSFEELKQKFTLPERLVSDLAFACEEVVTNIISYGYGDENEHWIRIVIRTDADHVEITIEDDGKPFNPLEHSDPNVSLSLEERAIGGLGVFLVKKLMDDVRYVREEPYNRLILTKRKT